MSITARTSFTHANAARFAIIAAMGVLALLAALHPLSPEFAPSWRMVSEYATGAWSWVLSLMFVSWAVSTWALAAALRPFAGSGVAKAGLVVLIIAGVGEAMAALFDITHPLHGAAAFLGILGLPVAAMLLGISLSRLPSWSPARTRIRLLSNMTWISVVLMGAAFGMFMTQLKAAGIEMSADAKPLTSLPAGVVPLIGWTNRLLIVVYCAWAIVMARQAERATR
ncbi:MAG: DUF998 domain-containing protein [Cytophagaceae bacterium]|nr:DUF998 domain-containing protein [Gemmatimonadaceae bacterium]